MGTKLAGQTSRTVTLTLNAQTNGTDGVKELANELQKLSKKGGEAAPEFERLSKELNAIAEQQDVVSAFNEISAATDNAKQSLDAARASTKAQDDVLQQLRLSLDAARAAEAAHAQQVNQAKSARQDANTGLLQARAAVTAYVSAIGGANSATQAQTAELKVLKQNVLAAKDALAQAKVQVAELTPEYDRLRAATAAANAEVQQQQKTFDSLERATQNAKAEYEQLSAELQTVSSAMQKVGADTKDVISVQNRLTQSMASLSREAADLKAKLEAPAASATTTANRIEQAFGVVGVRSAQAIKAEILKVNSALMTLANDTSVTEANFNRAFTAGKSKISELENELRKADDATKKFSSGLGEAFRQFTGPTLVFNAVSGVVNALQNAVTQVPKVTAEFQTMNRALTILTGSSTAAAKEFEYIQQVANRVGADIKTTGDAYIKLTAATKDTTLAGAQTKRIFEAVSGAMGTLGASAEATEGALMAVTQMVSKGVVSMEEMRQQLGERLPSSFQATAKELGITTGELTDLISSGKLAATDMLPALAAGLEKIYKTGQQNDTLIGKWREFTNAVKASANAVGSSGLLDSLLAVGRKGTAAIVQMGEGFIFVGEMAGKLTAGLATGNLKGALDDLADSADKMNKRVAQIGGYTDNANKSVFDLATQAKEAGMAMVTLSDGTQLATDDILKANDGFVKFLVESTKAQKSAEGFATSARKAAEYTRSAGEAAITSANAIGTETDKRRTATTVAENNALALQKLLDAERVQLTIMEQEAMKRAEAIRDKQADSDAHKETLVKLGEDIAQRRVVIDGIDKQVNANRMLAESLKLEVDLLKDNSANKDALASAATELATALAIARMELDAGRMSQEQYNIVENESRKAKRLYIDAVSDQKEAIKGLQTEKQAQFDLDRAAINLQIEQQKSYAASAKARGDEYGATQALLQVKRLEIQLSELTAKAKRAEAEAALALVAADREAILAKGAITKAQEAELRAREIGAQVKLKEAQIADETARGLRNLSNSTDQLTGANNRAAGSAGGVVSGLDAIGDAADRNAGRIGKFMSELDRYNANRFRNPGGELVLDKDGNVQTDRNGNAVTTSTSLLDQGSQAPRSVDTLSSFYKMGAGVKEAEIANKYFGEIFNRLAAAGSGSVRSSEDNARLIERASKQAAEQALAMARNELATGNSYDLGDSYSDVFARNVAQTGNAASTNGVNRFESYRQAAVSAGKEAMQTIKINIGSANKTVNVASQADAKTLTEVFRILENDSKRSF